MVADRGRVRSRQVLIAGFAALLGIFVGVLAEKSIRFAAGRAGTMARRLAATDPATVQKALVDTAGGVGSLAQAGTAVLSALVFITALVVRHRQSVKTDRQSRQPSTARSDILKLGLAVVIIVALLGLFTSVALLWTNS
jgi:hypothetical protein